MRPVLSLLLKAEGKSRRWGKKRRPRACAGAVLQSLSRLVAKAPVFSNLCRLEASASSSLLMGFLYACEKQSSWPPGKSTSC